MVQDQKFISRGQNIPAGVPFHGGHYYFIAAKDIPPNSLAARFRSSDASLNTNGFTKTPDQLFNSLPERPDPLLAVLAGFDTTAQPTSVIANNLKISGEGTSFQNTNATPNGVGMDGAAGESDKKKNEERAFWDRIIIFQSQLVLQLEEIHRRIDEINEKIRETKEEIDKLTLEEIASTQIITKANNHIKGTNLLAVGVDGKLKDKQMERAISELEHRTGQKINRRDEKELGIALERISQNNEANLIRIEDERKRLNKDLDTYDAQKRKLEQQKTHLEGIKNKLERATVNLQIAIEAGDQAEIRLAEQEIKSAEESFGGDTLDDLNEINTLALKELEKTRKLNASSSAKHTMGEVKDSEGGVVKVNLRQGNHNAATETSGAANVDIIFNMSAKSAASKIDPQESNLKGIFNAAHGPMEAPKLPEPILMPASNNISLATKFNG